MKCTAIILILLSTSVCSAQENTWRLFLERPDLLSELEITDEQEDELRQQLENVKQEFHLEQKNLESVRDESRSEYLKRLHELDMELPKREQACFSSVLLPHQQKRLNQLAFWAKANRFDCGYATVLLDQDVRKHLGIDSGEAQILKARAGEIQQDFNVEYAELQRKYLKKLVSESLNERQGRIIRKMMKETPSSPLTIIRF